MKPLTAKQVERVLLRRGYRLSRQRGSHRIYRHDGLRTSIAVPFHGGNKQLPIGTFRAIVRQSKISREDFYQ